LPIAAISGDKFFLGKGRGEGEMGRGGEWEKSSRLTIKHPGYKPPDSSEEK